MSTPVTGNGLGKTDGASKARDGGRLSRAGPRRPARNRPRAAVRGWNRSCHAALGPLLLAALGPLLLAAQSTLPAAQRLSKPHEDSPPRLDPAGAEEMTICTQNLWNYGMAEDVQRLRSPEASLETVRRRLSRQEASLVVRFDGCDVIAVQELVGDKEERARSALEKLAGLLAARTGHPYEARLADTHDVIRNGFLFRSDAGFEEAGFEGHHSADRLPRIPAFPRVSWDRGPAELSLRTRPPPPSGKGRQAPRLNRDHGTGSRGAPRRIRVITAHFKSKSERGGSIDPSGEKWERLRVVQARALLDLARRRSEEDPRELILVVGDLNNDRGTATRAVLAGRIEPAGLLTPRDCIDATGRVTCALDERPAALIDLADQDPDLRGRGSFRFRGTEELIDGIFTTPATAAFAREPGGRPGDYDIDLIGNFGQGSDHRLLKTRLRF